MVYSGAATVHYNLNVLKGILSGRIDPAVTGAWVVTARQGESNGRVVERPVVVALEGCRFHVGVAEQQRIAAGKARSVHAWVRGTTTVDVSIPDGAVKVAYHPHERGEFFAVESGMAVWFADRVVFGPDGVYAIGARS